jgi:hypothetical protein
MNTDTNTYIPMLRTGEFVSSIKGPVNVKVTSRNSKPVDSSKIKISVNNRHLQYLARLKDIEREINNGRMVGSYKKTASEYQISFRNKITDHKYKQIYETSEGELLAVTDKRYRVFYSYSSDLVVQVYVGKKLD